MDSEKTYSLSELGWTTELDKQFRLLDADGLLPARVVRQDRNRYQLLSEDGSVAAELSSKLFAELYETGGMPAVGDWVLLADLTTAAVAQIRRVLPRRSSFSRKVAGDATREQIVAANIDVVFLVSGLDNDFNLRRIERYVTLAWNSGAMPVIVLNKADLDPDLDERVRSVQLAAAGVDVVAISTLGPPGIDAVKPYLSPGTTIALLGSSGVGKSSLVNKILGFDRMETTPVRDDDSRGRHTTTYRELFVAPGGALLIDTPGMRELQLWADDNDVRSTFPEIEALAAECRFSDCAHDTEPGCAVHAAIDEGTLDRSRFSSYLKLRREVAFLERRKAESGFEQRRHDRSLGKLYKSIQKNNRKNKG